MVDYQSELWEAIDSLRETAGRLDVAIGRIESWKETKDWPCPEREKQIKVVEQKVNELEIKVATGLTTKAIIIAASTAILGAITALVSVWATVMKAISTPRGGG